MKSKKIIIGLIILGFAGMSSCETRTYDDVSGGVIMHPSYAKDIKPMIDNNCISCHDPNGSSPDLSTYQGVRDNAAAVYSDIFSGNMPQGGDKLPTTTVQTFQNWMNDGSPQN